MKYLVIWFITRTVPSPCPDFKPDPYTGEYPTRHCAVYHARIVTEKMEKSFDSKKDAQEFIAKGPKKIKFELIEAHAKEGGGE